MRTAAILAGGRARRLGGRAKPFLPIGDQRIIDHQIAVLRVVADELAVVAAETDRYDALDISVWEDLIPNAGPLGGIYTALVNATAPQTLVLAGDLPFVTAAFLEHLVQADPHADVVIPRMSDGHQPLCACYSRACAPVIRRQIESGNLKVTDLLAEVSVREIGPAELEPFDQDGHLLFNVNTPEDYRICLELMASKTE